MEESETSNSEHLTNNPFVALFGDVNAAKGFAHVTRTILQQQACSEVENEDNLSEVFGHSDIAMDKEDFDSIDQGDNKPIEIVTYRKEVLINDFLERIFLLTVDFNPDNFGTVQCGGLPSAVIKLVGLERECRDNCKPCLLSTENLSQALYERLQVENPESSILLRAGFQGNVGLHASCETRLLSYLSACYSRIIAEQKALQYIFSSSSFSGKISPENGNIRSDFHNIAESCFKLVLSFSGTVLLQPEIFPGPNVYEQLFDLLVSAYSSPDLYEYAVRLIGEHADEDDLTTMFSPVLDIMWKASEQFDLLHPNVFPVLNVLILFSENVHLSWCLLKSRYWLPVPGGSRLLNEQTILGSSFEHETILGRFLRLTSIPQHSVPSKLFLKPSQQSEAEMNAITENIRRYLDTLVSMIHKLLHNLLHLPSMQHAVLSWIGLCLNANTRRSQMYTDPTLVAGSGFFLNLSQVLLKFCEPFCSPTSKLLLKVDSRYCSAICTADALRESVDSAIATSVHAVGLEKYDPMVPAPEAMSPVEAAQSDAKFNFISEMFFLTHLCFKLGFVKTYEQYEEIMKRLRKLSNVYHDAVRQGGLQGDIENFRNDFEDGIRTQLAIKAHITTPTLSELALKFSISSGHWLVQQLLVRDKDSMILTEHIQLQAHLLTNTICPVLTIIPEFIVENVGETVRSLGNFSEESLESCDTLMYLMNFFAVFLGEKCRIKNPHLRAKLAECLAAFIPKEKSQSSSNTHFSMSYRKQAFEISQVVIEILPVSLLQLFVDIEFTGHTMEFDQKFMYRRYMYAILEYIWDIPSYRPVFKGLLKKGKKLYREEKTLSVFPRFVNLLVNDSTFLLDEALQNIVTIRELQQEKANGDWDDLSEQDRNEKEKNLSQCGRMAEGYNTMAKETVHVICYMTKEIDRPFVGPVMADSMAAFLNYFFVHLVGPKRKQLKVHDFDKINFDPGQLVKNITKIYLQLGAHEDFCHSIVKDRRSYSGELFRSAVEVLSRLEGAYDIADRLERLGLRLEELSKKMAAAEENMPDPPDEFIDPISCELMREPVKLPLSGKIVCRSTIAKHLLSDEKDPFNRSPLTLDQVVPCESLEQQIKEWLKENLVEPCTYSSDCEE